MTYTSLVQTYPQFVADQVLTQDQLNNMRIFLDSQNRATRVKLVGIGIVCGLHARVGDVEIKDKKGTVIKVVQGVIISEGYGVTSDGWLICIPEKKYIHIQDYTDPDIEKIGAVEQPLYRHWRLAYPNDKDNGAVNTQIPIRRLLEDEDVINGSASLNLKPTAKKNDLRGKVLLLYLEINETELKSCYTTDCNNKGQSIQLEVEALLIDKDSRFLPGKNKCNQLEPIQHVPRWSTALQMVFNKEVSQVDKPKEIKDAYQHICDFLSKELKDKINDFYISNELFFCLSEYEDLFNQVESKLDDLKGDPKLGQYNYDILKDISQAYNECVHQACQILKNCCSEEYFPRHLVIRDFDEINLSKTKGWRHPFYPSAVNNVMQQDLEKVRLLFARLLDLVNCFFANKKLPLEGIKITPSQSEYFPLAKRAIPFYFKNSIEKIWQLDTCCNLLPIGYHWNDNVKPASPDYFSYRENPLHYNLNANNFMRIEGHLGMKSKDVTNRIKELRGLHHLDFQIVELPLKATNPLSSPPSKINSGYQSAIQEWKDLYVIIAKGGIKKGDYDKKIKKIQSIHADIIAANKDWCIGQSEIELGCDFSSLQVDYNILRAELLCMLNRCKPVFIDLPDIEFEEGGGNSTGETCTDFSQLTVGTKYGKGIHQQGKEIISQNNLKIFVEEYIQGGNTNPSFNNANVELLTATNEKYIFVSNINFRFDLTAGRLGFTTNRVEFIFVNQGGSENLGIDNFSPAIIDFRDFRNKELPIPKMPGYTLEVIPIGGNTLGDKFRGIIRAPQIESVTLGGQEFALFEVCAFGESSSKNVEPKSLPEFTFESRIDRIKLLCDLLEKTMPHDIRCFNFSLFQQAIKDFAGTAIEIKLWLHCIFKSVEGRFLPYKFYPQWNDFEDCLDHIHTNCLYPRFSALDHLFKNTVAASLETFGSFCEKHPGAEHRAGVSPGGTFMVVYEDETKTNVLADFSLEHFVEECCSCKIDMKEIKFPPVVLADYRIIKIQEVDSQVKIEISVLDNDFSLHDTGVVKLLTPNSVQQSDKGAQLSFNSNTGIVTYEWDKAQEGIDHFTYGIANEHSKDFGHVYIGIFVEGATASANGKGQAAGRVLNNKDKKTPIVGATIQVMDKNQTEVTTVTSIKLGSFSFTAPEGSYSLNISHPNFLTKSFPNQKVVADLGVELDPFFLDSKSILPQDRRKVNEDMVISLKDKLINEPSFPLAETFVNNNAADPAVSLADVSKNYKKTTDQLLKEIKNSGGTKRAFLTSLLAAVNHSYMDRVVVENPEKANTTALKNLKKVNDTMTKEGISTDTLLRRWQSNKLKSAIEGSGQSITEIRTVFKKT